MNHLPLPEGLSIFSCVALLSDKGKHIVLCALCVSSEWSERAVDISSFHTTA